MRTGLLFAAKVWREQKETAEFFLSGLTVREKDELDEMSVWTTTRVATIDQSSCDREAVKSVNQEW